MECAVRTEREEVERISLREGLARYEMGEGDVRWGVGRGGGKEVGWWGRGGWRGRRLARGGESVRACARWLRRRD